ncbi:hypothetical protein [Agromyces atrinae]|uniref:CBM-cenC domain-containing protein n=1 Tax=Agromyces atrinae TaxID=592376 RepID=A0A4Q2M2X1_9MICO|nr:hypothetical protein [Agromyces atrinae]NYD65982.1 hypothetical protein [Agromyces atrinae]RXZ86314.1 hypothetical protein ESP50_11190 [Agromyces atrinae]
MTLIAGSLTVDESWSPHVQVSAEIAMPNAATLALLDPKQDRRLNLFPDSHDKATDEFVYSSFFNLRLREVEHNHEDNTLTLRLESAECLLQDKTHNAATPDYSAYARQASLRSIVNAELSKVGGSLEPGPDTSFYVLSEITNLIPNPSAETNALFWMGGGSFTIARSTAQAWRGSASIAVTATAAGSMAVFGCDTTQYLPTVPGTRYSFSAYVRGSVTRNAFLRLRWLDKDNNTLSDTPGPNVSVGAGGWTRIVLHDQLAPAGAVKVAPIITMSGVATGNVMYIDGAMLVDQAPGTDSYFVVQDFFDGAGGTGPAAALYSYSWTGTIQNSASRRTPLIDRAWELLALQPGVSSWDFLDPMIQAAGFRLFVDDTGAWYMVDGATHTAPGATQLSSKTNVTSADNSMSRDGDEWFDAAVMRYRWRDARGNERLAVDTYAPAGSTKTATFELEKPYPGPGLARYAVRRAAGKGRSIRIDALSDYRARASQEVRITLPNIPEQTGVIRSVSWDFETGLMRVETRGLTDTPPGSWLAQEITWADVPESTTWSTF